jgi:hypothetical protein
MVRSLSSQESFLIALNFIKNKLFLFKFCPVNSNIAIGQAKPGTIEL